MRPERQRLIRALFDEYIEMYASRDDRLTELFSENFSGYTGGGDFLVKNREEWVKITRQDFSQCLGVSASRCWTSRCRISATTMS
jgi:hypothetical protein